MSFVIRFLRSSIVVSRCTTSALLASIICVICAICASFAANLAVFLAIVRSNPKSVPVLTTSSPIMWSIFFAVLRAAAITLYFTDKLDDMIPQCPRFCRGILTLKEKHKPRKYRQKLWSVERYDFFLQQVRHVHLEPTICSHPNTS